MSAWVVTMGAGATMGSCIRRLSFHPKEWLGPKSITWASEMAKHNSGVTERVDDVALLIGQMVKRGLPELLDRHIPRHWTQRGLSWGWTAVIWLAYIVTEGDHRKVSVETYLKGMHHTLSALTAQGIEPLDFSDDRLSLLLTHLSKKAYWHQIEHDLNARSIEVYDLSQDVIRCDATTVSGAHEVTAEGVDP